MQQGVIVGHMGRHRSGRRSLIFRMNTKFEFKKGLGCYDKGGQKNAAFVVVS